MSAPAAPLRIRRVVVVGKLDAAATAPAARKIEDWLRDRGVAVRLDAETARGLGRRSGVRREAVPRDTDLVVIAGGDGTLLSMARVAAPLGVPILGVNLGSLGFLTEIRIEDLFEEFERVLAGDFAIEERRMLRMRMYRGKRRVGEQIALNDVVVAKSEIARMVNLDVRVDDQRVAEYTSDGLIVATPTGSTAYSLSAGGPVLDPRLSAFVVTPICPHTLAFRPLVVPGDVAVEIRLRPTSHEGVMVTIDGQVGVPMQHGDRLVVDQHPARAKLVRVAGRSFFEVLRRKLHWGER